MDNHSVLKTQSFDLPGHIQVIGKGTTHEHICHCLRLLNHTTALCQDSKTAVDVALAVQPDLVLISIESCGADAFEVCRAIKNHASLQDTPVVLIASSEDELEQMCAFESGANDILIRPNNQKVLGARIRTLIKYRNAVRQLRASRTQLEDRIKERTLALQHANESLANSNTELKREIRERARAEAELRKSQEALRQSQKVEALGQLAGGVAHDFNNILFVIMGYAESIKSRLAENHSLHSAIDQILRSSERAANLTKQLLAFGRRQVLTPRVLRMEIIIGEMSGMLCRLLGAQIELKVQSEKPTHNVKFDPIQIEQIVMNLAVNARDAMPGGGVLELRLANAHVDENFVASHPGALPGEYVRLTVSDTGTGMDEEVCKQIFDPFFTTKEAGRGTGLGLSVVSGIVSQGNGFIDVKSVPGKGTSFNIYLPPTEEEVSSPLLPAVECEHISTNATVLVVEDDILVRNLLSSMLKKEGYKILEAGDGAEAREILESGVNPDILLTDILMPKMTGAELATYVRIAHPNLRMIFMSANASDLILNLSDDSSREKFIQKPFLRRAVLRQIREMLESAAP